MEQWELQIQGFPEAPDPRVFSKALQTAATVLKTDLVDFETDRLFHTLMEAPVNLLSTVLSQYQEEEWSNNIMEAFKLLAAVAGQYRYAMEPYFENIVKISQLSHIPHVRRQALFCLAELARVTPHGAANAQRFASELESATACKTELALLVGTLCEFHPEVLENQATRIWRTYLSFLGRSGLTDKFVSSVLEGISCLLVSFGNNLPVNELWEFYDTMVRLYTRCRNVCIKILRLHAALFKERIADDVTTRARLWSIATENGVAGALIGVYEAVAAVKGSNMKVIIEQEVLPQLSTANKLPALTLLASLRGRGFDTDLESCVDVQNLEFELRGAGVTYYVADLIVWYIGGGLAHSLRLSQTALLFYQNLPPKKVNDLAAAILTQPKVREEAISFLASECCQPGANSLDYMAIWRALFVEAGPPHQRSEALQDFVDYVTFVLDSWREEGGEVLPEKIASLLTLTTDILSLPVAEVSYDLLSLAVSDALRHCSAAELMSAAAAVLARGGTLQDDVWPRVRVWRCRAEGQLCACCVLSLHAPHHVHASHVLPATQIIFSRHDVEDATLLRAVEKLEYLLVDADPALEPDLQNAICLVRKLQSRKVADKDARILQRHINVFLGQHGGKTDLNNNESEVRVVTAKLKDSLYLAVPHLETERVKLNLQEVIQLAIEQEDPVVLQELLKIICANLNSRRDPTTLSALSLCCRALCRGICRGATSAASRGVVQRALMYCDTPLAVHDLLTFISEEQSPGVRTLLCSCLPAILTDELLASAVSRAANMMTGSGRIKRAGMDVTDALLPSLEDNHALIKSLLPLVLERIAKTNELEAMSTFENATKLYLDKLALFEIGDVDRLMRKLIHILIVGRNVEKYELETYKSIADICIRIAKAVTDTGKTQYSRVVEMVFNVIDLNERDFFKGLYVLAILRNKFDFQSSYSSTMFFNKTLLQELYDVEVRFSEDDVFQLEAILIFMKEYAETLLEYDYEKTAKLLASILRDIPQQSVVNHGHSLKICLSTYKAILKSFPRVLEDSIEVWLSALPLPQIQQHFIEESHYVTVRALNIYLDMSGFHLHSLMETLKTWPKHILRKYIDGASGKELSFLTDCLTAAVKVSSFNVKSLLLEGRAANEYIGVKFCAKFMNVLLKSFLKKPYVLLDRDVKECCVVLDDIVKFCVKRNCTEEVYENVLDLVNEVWPTYESNTSFQQKCALLSNISGLPKSLRRESNPMQWVAAQLNGSASREDSTILVGVLPGGDEFAECYAWFAQRCLSARARECAGAALRAALDALAAGPSHTLLNIVAKLATDENNPQEQDKWWVKAMDSCCASLARHDTFKACDTLLQISDDSLSLGVCKRLMLPLLRYSTATYCEQFFSRNLKTLLDCLTKKPRDTRAASKYQLCVVERTRALLLLQVAFEKIPLSNLQSPQSVLYRELNLDKPTSNYLTATVCKLCVTLRKEECPQDADDGFRESFRLFQCAIYNCLCAAICKSKPADKFYDHIVGWQAWGKISDDGDKYQLPVHTRRRKTRQSVSIPVANSAIGTSATPTTTRTKMFLRTLSEDPHKFDLYSQETEEVEIQELQMSDSEINKHMCAGTLTALLAHTSELSCWTRVCTELTNTLSSHPSYLLAQCICNCHEALTPHARELRPALLAFTANTLQDGRLNGLHVDILETLSHWRDDPTLPTSSLKHLQCTIEALIKEAIDSKETFLHLLDSVLEIYSKSVTVDWSVLSQHIHNHNWRCLPVIQRLTKHKIRIPELVPALIQVDLKYWLQDIKIAEVFGAALSCESESETATQSFRDMLKRVKQSEAYIKMLYYTQLGSKSVCDEASFRQVTDQTRKLPKTLQNKCLHILSTYVSVQERPTDHVASMFETIELNEFLTTDNVEALGLVAKGLRLMSEGLKRRVVKQALDYCGHSSVKVKKAAFAVAAAAFQELFPTETSEEPSAKRRKKSTLLTISDETDPYVLNVVRRVAEGVTSYNDDVTAAVKTVLKKSAGERLAECFSLLLAGEIQEQSGCAALLDIFFAELRSNDSFLACKLRDEPLEPIEPKGASKLFTETKTCRGTLLSYRASGSRRQPNQSETPATEVDVQVSIDSILDSLLQFAKSQPLVARALTLQTVRCLSGRGFDVRATLASLLAAKLATPSDATPLYILLGRVVVDSAVTSQKFEEAVKSLKEKASLSDDAELVKCLYEEFIMRKNVGIFELRSAPMPIHDVEMEEAHDFSIPELIACFGQLANWDELTLQQQAAKRVGLPALWTDEDSFKTALDVFKDTPRGDSWFDTLVSSYCDDTRDSARWLLDAQKWPRRRFNESAVAEALSWQLDAGAAPWACEISPRDCLVECSARLMIRVAQASEREAMYSSHSNELLWCVRANETGLYRGVLQCCDRNNTDVHGRLTVTPTRNDDDDDDDFSDLIEDEKISWLHQKLLALNGMALERNDSSLLKGPLSNAAVPILNSSSQTPEYNGILKLYLENNLEDLTSNDINRILETINEPMENAAYENKRTLTSLFETALTHYHQQWDDDKTKQDEVIANIAFALYRMRESNLGPSDQHVALLLNRLYEYSGSIIEDDEVKNKIVHVFYPRDQYLDDFTTEQIHDIRRLFSMLPPEPKPKRDYKKLFATIRDVAHCLLKYCEGLVKAVKKRELWNEIFQRIREMFENPYAGSDYRLLAAQKDKLYAIANFDSNTTEMKLEALRSVMVSLDQPAKTNLRVSQLCPSLMMDTDELAKLLPRGDVVKVEDHVSVITNSIRRPCIITVLTSLGTRRRFVHKSGESLKRDASVIRLDPDAKYKVIPTSEDSGLMDYLEDHETLYSLISSVCNLDEISASVQRPLDEELIVTPSAHTFTQLRDKVPVHALRTAMERNSSCFEDFLMKKKNFQDSLATTAVFNWILGLGDRHLENFMCSMRSGQLVSIDCGAALSFVRELPAARLTPAILALTDTQVLEARLQVALSRFRRSEQQFCNFVRMTFAWSAADVEDKLPHIRALVSGRRLSHHVTRALLDTSHWTYKDAYLKLIDEVFEDYEDKDEYTIVEQISCLLRHCTSPRILQVTRSGWTPWV